MQAESGIRKLEGNRRISLITGCLISLSLLFAFSHAIAAEQISAERTFTLRVLPLLKEKCFACHGDHPQDVKASLDVRSRDGLLKGGESGEASLVPGNPAESILYQAVLWEGYEMPPKENDRLSPGQIATIERWIKAGAPWPDEAVQARYREEANQMAVTEDGVKFTTSGGTSAEWSNRRYQLDDLWSFQPVRVLLMCPERSRSRFGLPPLCFEIDLALRLLPSRALPSRPTFPT
ncbi:MAG: hypothetical protein KDA91_22435 [Planctomycetaceae bacterium]|nr:hypothetical protein [Planctomycetaceae bacterium]